MVFFKQASQVDLNAPDILYYIGEVESALGDQQAALDAYNQAIERSSAFAPAYLGRAHASLKLNPQADIGADLQAALERDPALAEAHLAAGGYTTWRTVMCRLPCKRWIQQSSSSRSRRSWQCTNPRPCYCKATKCRPWSWHVRLESAT